MSIPNEALQKVSLAKPSKSSINGKDMLINYQLLVEIEQKAAVTQQQMLLVKAQVAAKRRENRMLQLTSNEIESLSDETRVYEGVGKM